MKAVDYVQGVQHALSANTLESVKTNMTNLASLDQMIVKYTDEGKFPVRKIFYEFAVPCTKVTQGAAHGTHWYTDGSQGSDHLSIT
jgi:hypothetical protein